MDIDKKTIAAIIEACPAGTDLACHVHHALGVLRCIRNELTDARQAVLRAEGDAKRKVAEARDKEQAVQGRCPHYSTTFHPDPSGNNDSSTTCNLCGKEIVT